MQTLTTLIEAARYFFDPQVCIDYVARLRWPNDITCPHCGCLDLSWLTTRRIWKCKGCKKQFSVKVGTIFENSPLGLDKWLCAIWLIANAKNGISSYEVARAMGVTQKTAWFLLHRVRLAMETGTFEKLSGTIEADETYIGGLEKNEHETKKQHAGRRTVGKAVGMGLLERHSDNQSSQVRTKHIPNTRRETIQPEVRANMEPGSNLYTDTHAAYEGLEDEYIHEAVNHLEAYVRGMVYTNGLENYWGLFKRCFHGTWTHLSDEHLHRYLSEQRFRFNDLNGEDGDRFVTTAGRIQGRQLTYKQLIVRPLTARDD